MLILPLVCREVQVGEEGARSVIIGIWHKPVRSRKGKEQAAEVPLHLLDAQCDVCLEPIWTSDDIRGVFWINIARGQGLSCQACLERLFSLVRFTPHQLGNASNVCYKSSLCDSSFTAVVHAVRFFRQ